MTDHALRPKFHPRRTEPCLCGSGKRFKDCCGSQAPGRPLPHGVGLRREWLDATTRQQWLTTLAEQPRRPATVLAKGRSSADNAYPGRATARQTGLVDAGPLDESIRATFRSALEGPVASATGHAFAWLERPEILRYAGGDHFVMHADSERYDQEAGAWRKMLDRDISLLLYLNDDFEGGTLDLVFFRYTYRPRAGDLLWFPSDHRYLHRANQVTSGVRWVIACWAAFRDVPRVMNDPPAGRTDLDEA